ncbi:SDR family oxidoreductase [Streptomyces sp. NBC_01264]|uniref:SDR family oxidoreductase n=1 Tax=Streptomyces sp. NBC_01264 TaxID=2903804 RepID=UPI0022559E0E|nr:SDR family oxidoreductase [Streptomyces sp. NBC_01264]MCX4781627.1 SDR family oxidoreductase [Streptomyces sp. NBC_01264]
MQLKNKNVVVTGAASGIGLGLAARFVTEGARVVMSDLATSAGADRAKEIGARFVAADVSRESDIAALVDDVLTHEGHIDLFCSNAGIATRMDALADDSTWERIIDVNLNGQIRAARHVLPHMLERGEGYLLNTASAAGLLTELESVGYATTKHASVGFSEWLAFTYRDRGIGVSVLCPEGVHTPMAEQAPYLLHNAITVEDVADTVVEALRTERFMITTHASTLERFRLKAVDYEGYINALVGRRSQVLGGNAR